MKHTYILLIVFNVCMNVGYACDICGCGIGGNYTGLLPQFNKRIMGIRYQQRSLVTHLGPHGETSYLTAQETMRSIEYWGAWQTGSRSRLLVAIPWQFQQSKTIDTRIHNNSIGDLSAIWQWNLFQSRQTDRQRVRIQQWWLGAGIKLPTGKWSKQSLQPTGTGSTDFLFNMVYDHRLQDAGISASLQYRINTANALNYRYGNRFTGTVQYYYKFRPLPSVSLAPNMGMIVEHGRQDRENGWRKESTGGYTIYFAPGLETVLKKIAIGAGLQLPVGQNNARGTIREGSRWMVHTSILL